MQKLHVCWVMHKPLCKKIKVNYTLECVKSADGQIRTVKLKVSKSNNIISRPVNLVYPLELHCSEPEDGPEAESTECQPKRDRRRAAEEASKRITQCLEKEAATILFCGPEVS